MNRKLFNLPHVLWQTPDSEDDMANDALGVCVDNGGTICICQGSSEIVINKATVPELTKLLAKLAKA